MNILAEPAIWFPTVRAGTGTDTFTVSLVNGLLRRGFRAEIFWLPHRAEYLPWSVSIPKPPNWANIIHINSWLHRRFIPKEFPVVATVHSSVHDPRLTLYKNTARLLYHQYWIRQLEQQTLSAVHRIVAVSCYTADQTIKAFGINNKNIVVNHNGIDLSVFRPVPRDAPCHPFRLLFVGNWSILKGVDLLEPIMSRLGSDFELVYTTSRNPIKQPKNPPVGSSSLGNVSNPYAMAHTYQNADALLFPTRLEGLPLAALEAQACGLPVISSDSSSLPEIIKHADTGILCPTDNVTSFVEAAQLLADNPSLWRRMSEAARVRTETYFNIETMIDNYLDIYRTILTEKLVIPKIK